MSSGKDPEKMRYHITCLIVFLLASIVKVPTPTRAQITQLAGEKVAFSLRKNVVKVNSEAGDGFGFITGEQNGRLYIATADHVVRNNESIGKKITVEFFSRQGKVFEADLLGTRYGKPQDLAVLEVVRPEGVSWDSNCAAIESDKLVGWGVSGSLRGIASWFIGRQAEDDPWFIPPRPGFLIDNPDAYSLISVDITTVLPGTSGAPLITDRGIIGMIVQDEGGGVARALSIEFIKKVFQSKGHWGLAPFPYRSDEQTAGSNRQRVRIKLDKISVHDNGEGETNRWRFDVFANDNFIFADHGQYTLTKSDEYRDYDASSRAEGIVDLAGEHFTLRVTADKHKGPETVAGSKKIEINRINQDSWSEMLPLTPSYNGPRGRFYLTFVMTRVRPHGSAENTDHNVNSAPCGLTLIDTKEQFFTLNNWTTKSGDKPNWIIEQNNGKLTGRALITKSSEVGYLKDICLKNFTLNFHIKFKEKVGAAWALRLKDPNNYYLFCITGPKGPVPNRFCSYIVKDGKFDLNAPINPTTLPIPMKANNEYIITVKVNNNEIEHEILPVRLDPRVDGVNYPVYKFTDPASSLDYGRVGFCTVGDEEFYLANVILIPEKLK